MQVRVSAGKHPLIGATDKALLAALLAGLSWLDRLLAPFVLLAMIIGVVIGMRFRLDSRPKADHDRQVRQGCGSRSPGRVS